MTHKKTTPPHWRISLSNTDETYSNLVDLYQSKMLTAKGALFGYFQIRIKEGWKIKVKPKKLMQIFTMPRSTVWKALNDLRDEELINYSDPEELEIELCPKNWPSSKKLDTVQNIGQPSNLLDSHPKNETDGQNIRQPSKILDEQPPEASQSKDSSNLSTSYQLSSTLLSGEEEEEICTNKESGQNLTAIGQILNKENGLNHNPPNQNNVPSGITKADKLTPQLIRQLESLRIPLDNQVRACINEHHHSQIGAALIYMASVDASIKSPKAMFLSIVPRQEIDNRPSYEAAFTDEFKQWYKQAIKEKIVVNRPIKHLGLYQFREPIVTLTNGQQWPWTKVRDNQHIEADPEQVLEMFSKWKNHDR